MTDVVYTSMTVASQLDKSRRVLWIAPNLNHYKKRLLNHLAANPKIDLHVIAGRIVTGLGHRKDVSESHYRTTEVKATKKNFAWHWQTYSLLSKMILSDRPQTVLFPLERKLLPLLIWVRILKILQPFRLISYNHPILKMRLFRKYGFDKWITKTLYKLYDGIVFYTETAKDWSVDNKMIQKSRAYFANNTLDTDRIDQHTSGAINKTRPLRLLFIGRLIPTKRLDLLLEYFEVLQIKQPEMELTIIGDGPLANIARNAAAKNKNIRWLGAITEEKKISSEMNNAFAVFIPGESGLSVVHAFAYGKPYFTLDLPSLNHGPELSYLDSGKEGLILSGNKDEDCKRIIALINNEAAYSAMCRAATKKSIYLSTDNWCDQMVNAMIA